MMPRAEVLECDAQGRAINLEKWKKSIFDILTNTRPKSYYRFWGEENLLFFVSDKRSSYRKFGPFQWESCFR